MRLTAYPFRLAVARLRHRLGRAGLVALGVATGAGALAAVLAGSLVAQDRSLQQNVQRLDPAQRVLRAVWGGIPAQSPAGFQTLDGISSRTLKQIGRAHV